MKDIHSRMDASLIKLKALLEQQQAACKTANKQDATHCTGPV
jgi:hypothetical protein